MSTYKNMLRRIGLLIFATSFLVSCGGGMSELTSGYVELNRATLPTIKREYTNP